MCVLCGYIGRREAAASVLLRMGERMQGLWSGFYTGIGVLGNDGVIRHRKTTGSSKYWRERFSTDELPGNTGLFHSRTNSGGDARYAHPFVSSDGSVMLVSQGTSGVFASREQEIVNIGNRLLDQDVRFSSRIESLPFKKYQILKDGSQVHVSDIVCEYAAFLAKTMNDPLEIVRKTGSDILEEAVSLYVFRRFPGHVYTTNVNSRLAIQVHEDFVAMSSSKLAFDDDSGDPIELSTNSVADISLDGILIKRLSGELQVRQIPQQEGLTDAVLDWIRTHPGTSEANIKDQVLNPRCPDKAHQLYSGQVHPILEQLLAEGKVRLEDREVPGPNDSDLGLKTEIYIR